MRSALFFATLILLMAMLPVFFLEGVSGALFQPLAVSYVLAVLASMLVALIVTPGLSLILLSRMATRRQANLRSSPAGCSVVTNGFWRGPSREPPGLAYVADCGSRGGRPGRACHSSGRTRLLPAFQEPYLMIQLEGAPGTSHPEMDRIVARASSELRAIPGVRNVGAHVGRAVFGDQVVGINSAELWVSI